jgi:hypothetical protein
LLQEAAQTAQALPDQPVGLTAGGWVFISIAWATIISLAVFCYRKVLQKAAEKRQEALLESPSLTERMTDKKAAL